VSTTATATTITLISTTITVKKMDSKMDFLFDAQ
jgi:hypothetical protein